MSAAPENLERLKSMMEAATLSMTWHPVKIILCAPIYKYYSGEAYRAADGRFAIAIKPDLDLAKFYMVWLHEMGHIFRGDCDEMLPRILSPEMEKAYVENGPLGAPFFQEETAEELKEYRESPEEMDANSFALDMDHIATFEALHLYGNIEIESRIRVLMNVILTPLKEEEKSHD